MQISYEMEKEEIKQRGGSKRIEPEVFLQWGTKKRLRCVRVRDPHILSQRFKSKNSNNNNNGVINRKFTSRFDRFLHSSSSNEKENSHLQSSHRVTRGSEAAILRSTATDNHRKSSSTEKEDRYYATRGSVGVEENGKVSIDVGHGDDKGGHVWPKLFITLSSKEKEEDFMAMKGCKPPQRPKKRAKMVQKSLLLVSPGAWLTDMCQERYEVREKKSSKKKPRGLKAMGGSMDSDSD